jgi:hypothetical protein
MASRTVRVDEDHSLFSALMNLMVDRGGSTSVSRLEEPFGTWLVNNRQ